jgi:hypothetical protein
MPVIHHRSTRAGGFSRARLARIGGAMAIGLFGTAAVALLSAGPSAAKEAHAASAGVRHHDVPGFPGTSTSVPYNECPAIGADPSCAILIDVTTSGATVLQDPAQTNNPYDGSDDTLVGILNQTGNPLYGIQLSSSVQPPIFGFDGDGICTFSAAQGASPGYTGDSYCSGSYYTSDPGDYAGPVNTYGEINSTQTAGLVSFPQGLANNSGTYFSLENTLVASQITTGGSINTPPGYDLAGSDGGVFVFPTTSNAFFGSLPSLGIHVNNIVGMVPTNNFQGYDLVGSDGGVFVFPVGQTTGFYGALPPGPGGVGVHVSNVVGIVPTNGDTGYDLVGSDGGVFVFPVGQQSGFYGSLPGKNVHTNNIVGIIPTSDGGGYFLVGKDGGVFGFGDATFLGSLPGLGISVNNIVSIAATPDDAGYWVVSSTGSVYAFGDAIKYGDLPTSTPPVNVSNVVSIVPTPDGFGYWLIGADGSVYKFGDATFYGDLPQIKVTVNNIVGAVPTL